MSGEMSVFDFIAKYEGIEKDIYLDHKGIPTIGVGYNLKNKEVLLLVLDKLGYSKANVG